VEVFKEYTAQSVIPKGMWAEKAMPVVEILGERAKSETEFEIMVMPDSALMEAVSIVIIAFKGENKKRMTRMLPTLPCIKKTSYS